MWRTPNGTRTLKGGEAALLRASIWYLWDQLEEAAEHPSHGREVGISIFDKMTWQQQLIMLADVGEALLCDEIPPPQFTAISEATVGALYENIFQCVNAEIDLDDPDVDMGHRTYWRQLIRNAGEALNQPDLPRGSDGQLLEADCLDTDEWDYLIEAIEDAVLWDEDWDFEDLFLDADPEVAQHRKDFLGVCEDYFTAIPPDPNESEVETARLRLRALVSQLDR